VNHALNHKFNEANQLAHKLIDINPLMYRESNPVGIKQALNTLDICQNHVRLPLISASSSLQKEISKAISQMM